MFKIKTLAFVGLSCLFISACTNNDAAEQAMKDADKLNAQAQALAVDAMKQAGEQMQAAKEMVGKSLDDARAQMKIAAPSALDQINAAEKKIQEAQSKMNQENANAQQQIQNMKK